MRVGRSHPPRDGVRALVRLAREPDAHCGGTTEMGGMAIIDFAAIRPEHLDPTRGYHHRFAEGQRYGGREGANHRALPRFGRDERRMGRRWTGAGEQPEHYAEHRHRAGSQRSPAQHRTQPAVALRRFSRPTVIPMTPSTIPTMPSTTPHVPAEECASPAPVAAVTASCVALAGVSLTTGAGCSG